MFTSTSEAVASVPGSLDFAQAAPLRAPARAPRDEHALAEVWRHPCIWRRGSAPLGTLDIQPSGIAELDARLPGGGWPRGALSEILIQHDGIGECSLVLPALAAMTRAKRRVVF